MLKILLMIRLPKVNFSYHLCLGLFAFHLRELACFKVEQLIKSGTDSWYSWKLHLGRKKKKLMRGRFGFRESRKNGVVGARSS